ncbi:unnamed protein product [Amoebophrya sp. A25]|nr:unnamed protein product [Amoebophrya sp. A25]|eukprot:GSA25T00025591001.1
MDEAEDEERRNSNTEAILGKTATQPVSTTQDERKSIVGNVVQKALNDRTSRTVGLSRMAGNGVEAAALDRRPEGKNTYDAAVVIDDEEDDRVVVEKGVIGVDASTTRSGPLSRKSSKPTTGEQDQEQVFTLKKSVEDEPAQATAIKNKNVATRTRASIAQRVRVVKPEEEEAVEDPSAPERGVQRTPSVANVVEAPLSPSPATPPTPPRRSIAGGSLAVRNSRPVLHEGELVGATSTKRRASSATEAPAATPTVRLAQSQTAGAIRVSRTGIMKACPTGGPEEEDDEDDDFDDGMNVDEGPLDLVVHLGNNGEVRAAQQAAQERPQYFFRQSMAVQNRQSIGLSNNRQSGATQNRQSMMQAGLLGASALLPRASANRLSTPGLLGMGPIGSSVAQVGFGGNAISASGTRTPATYTGEAPPSLLQRPSLM